MGTYIGEEDEYPDYHEPQTGGVADGDFFDEWGDKGEVLPDDDAKNIDMLDIVKGTLRVRRPKKVDRVVEKKQEFKQKISNRLDSALRLKKKKKKKKEDDDDDAKDVKKPKIKEESDTDKKEAPVEDKKEIKIDNDDPYAPAVGDLPESTQQHTISSRTFRKKTTSMTWSDEETTRFYRALSMFNLNFSLLQNMFPGKSEKDCKKKYAQELQKHPKKVNKALANRNVKIDVMKYTAYKDESDRIRELNVQDPFATGEPSFTDADPLAQQGFEDDDDFGIAEANAPDDKLLSGLLQETENDDLRDLLNETTEYKDEYEDGNIFDAYP